MKRFSTGEKILTEPKKNKPEQCVSLVTEEEKVFVAIVAVLKM